MNHDPIFEPEFVQATRHLFEEMIPFNKLLGLKLVDMGAPHCRIAIESRPELIGNFVKNILHGGVTASVIDLVGGFAVFVEGSRANMHLPWQDRMRLFASTGTIDMRVDYLEGGAGPRFEFVGEVVRLGRRVSNVRVDAYNHEGKRFATGTAVYVNNFTTPSEPG